MKIRIKVFMFKITLTSEDIAEAIQNAYPKYVDDVKRAMIITFLDEIARGIVK